MIDFPNIPRQIKYNVLLIGDSCTDYYKIGNVERLSPEAPVPIIKISKEYSVPGMASNVLNNLNQFPFLYIDFVTNEEPIKKIRYLDERSGQHLLRVDEEPLVNEWNRETKKPLNNYDCVIISDYNKGFLSYENIEYVINECKCPIFIDTKKQDLTRFHGAFVKINELEFKNRYSINDKLIVTLGSKGAMYKKYNQEYFFPTKQVDVVDVCGCGDTFLAALSYYYTMSSCMGESIAFANKAAGVTVQHQGNYTPTLEEINAL